MVQCHGFRQKPLVDDFGHLNVAPNVCTITEGANRGNPESTAMENDDIDEMDDEKEIITDLLDTSQEYQPSLLGSHKGKKPNIEENYMEDTKRMQRQYFSENLTYGSEMFRRRFLFRERSTKIFCARLKGQEEHFIQQKNCCNRNGISTHVQINVSFCILAYSMPPDGSEDSNQIFESTARETM